MSGKYIGEIYYKPTQETLKYTDAEKFINDFRNMLDYTGIMGVSAKVYNKNDLDLCYQVHAIIKGDFGDCEPKAQYIIEKTAPEFNLAVKLKQIHYYETRTNKTRPITRGDGYSEIYLDDHIVNNISIKSVKNLVDRRHVKALRVQRTEPKTQTKSRKKRDCLER